MIERLTILGVGLIGGSLALALRKAGAVREIVGVGRSPENLQLAVERGIIDRFTHDARAGVAGADMVFLGAPVASIVPLALEIRPALAPGAVVTDGGSTKATIAEALRLPYASPPEYEDGDKETPPAFVPGHPIAGTEKSGAGAAFAELFEGRRSILTPVAETPQWAVERVRAMWAHAGADVEIMTPAHHDTVLAAISHLPHAAAYALVDAVRSLEESSGQSILGFAAGGFADITRIAASDPVMWRDIFLANKPAILQALGTYEKALAELRGYLEADDGAALERYIGRAKLARERLPVGQVKPTL
jgi:prephenate dehydrogenase